MLINIRANNAFVFNEEIEFSMKADMRSSRLSANVFSENNMNILKVAGIYGPNNSGKTCLIKCIKAIKQLILDENVNFSKNLFSEINTSNFGICFLNNGKIYDYSIIINSNHKEILYEKFSEIIKDIHGNEKHKDVFIRDTINEQYECIDEKIKKILPIISKNNILIHLVDTEVFSVIAEVKNTLFSFANKIDILDMNDIPLDHTINILKNKAEIEKDVVDFIKNADLDLDDYKYMEVTKSTIENYFKSKDVTENISEKVLKVSDKMLELISLASVHKGKMVPSITIDSTGTKKIVALASYIIEAIKYGRILIVDELDSSIHFRLTRAIVSMFNNELNKNAQLIFTVHDINLMDCKKLFRKEQIWFIDKDEDGVYLYSLADFTASSGVRDTSDVIEKYKKGMLGALPEPELVKSLLQLSSYSAQGEKSK